MRALVVEDDPISSELSRHLLEQEGFTVDEAETGQHAIARVQETSYDAIVLDLGLPDVDGLQVMEAIRREGRTTPVLVLTADQDAEMAVRALDAGADDYLRKPPALSEFRARVRALVRRSAATSMEELTCGNVTLNRLSRQLFVEGAEVLLTSKELPLLEHLTMHQDQVVSRADLLHRVWGMDCDPGSNIVDVNVARIRRKLTLAGADVVITSKRGVGFVLERRLLRAGSQKTAPTLVS